MLKLLQKALNSHGFDLKVDGILGPKTKAAIAEYQEISGLYVDGIPGPNTLESLGISTDLRGGFIDQPKKLSLIKCPANKCKGGYDHFLLRSDVANSYNRIYEIVSDAGAILTSSGSKRSLKASVGPNRSRTSPHYCAIAVDLHIWSAALNPEKDPYLIELDSDHENYFILWAKTKNTDHALVNTREIQAIFTPKRGAKPKTKKIKAQVINLTSLFAAENWRRVPARGWYFSRGVRAGAEWWHFQYENLEPDTTFGNELLKLYDRRALMASPVWKYRHRKFKKSWLTTSA